MSREYWEKSCRISDMHFKDLILNMDENPSNIFEKLYFQRSITFAGD